MILYSIISSDDIFCTCTDELPQTGFSSVKGGVVEYVEQNGVKTVRRLISTDPFMYLNSRYSPSAYFSGK